MIRISGTFVLALFALEGWALWRATREFGVLPVLAWLGVAFGLGLYLLMHQATGVLTRVQEEMRAGRPPDGALLEATVVMIAAALFALPGVLSDIAAVVLLVPGLRQWLAFALGKRWQKKVAAARAATPRPIQRDRVVDATFDDKR